MMVREVKRHLQNSTTGILGVTKDSKQRFILMLLNHFLGEVPIVVECTCPSSTSSKSIFLMKMKNNETAVLCQLTNLSCIWSHSIPGDCPICFFTSHKYCLPEACVNKGYFKPCDCRWKNSRKGLTLFVVQGFQSEFIFFFFFFKKKIEIVTFSICFQLLQRDVINVQ